MQRGGDLQTHRIATRFDTDGSGVQALLTDQGPLRANAFLLAAGVGAAALARTAGIHLPIYPLKGYSITVRPASSAVRLRTSITDARRKVVFAPIGDRVRVSGFVEIARRAPKSRRRASARLLDAAREVLAMR